MKWSRWQLIAALMLIGLSAGLYAVHYIVFDDAHHILLWSFTNLAFLPISVLFVSLIVGRLLAHRDRQAKMEKMNMVIGAFFSEVGNDFLRVLAAWDEGASELQARFRGIGAWQLSGFEFARKQLSRTPRAIDADRIQLVETHLFLNEKRDFLLRLLENPNLLEHEAFTALLRAVLHVAEELGYRENLDRLPADDRMHLAGDCRRVYVLLLQQWLLYMAFIKRAYPYLFSLAVRTNPLDPSASPEVGEMRELQ